MAELAFCEPALAESQATKWKLFTGVRRRCAEGRFCRRADRFWRGGEVGLLLVKEHHLQVPAIHRVAFARWRGGDLLEELGGH